MAQKKAHEVDNYLGGLKADNAPLLILVYGADVGGVYDIAHRLRKIFLKGSDDEELQYTALTQEILSGNPAALAQEATSIGLFGADSDATRRLVHLPATINAATATNAVNYFLDEFDDKPSLQTNLKECLVVVEGGNLTPSSALRKHIEKHPRAMALPCYALQPRDVAALARKELKSAGFDIETPALNLLGERLAGDRGIMARELERLILYKGGDRQGATLIQIPDIEILFGASEQSNINALADAIALGALAKMDALIAELTSAGVAPIGMLAAVRGHFQNLHLASGLRADGAGVAAAVSAIRPPVHFLRKRDIEKQLALWNRTKTNRALAILSEAEQESRNHLAATAVARSFLRLAMAAKR